MNPTVSIIIPTFNSGPTIEDCLKSIVQQTYPHKNVVVIDGQSTDNTLSILENYRQIYPYIEYVSEKDNGIYDAMNKGIDKATGDYLLFLGSDDSLYSKNVLEAIFSDAENEEYDFIYGNVFLKHSKQLYSGPSSFEKLVGDQISICHQAIFYKRELFYSIGRYNLKYFVHADYDLNVLCFKSDEVRKKYVDLIITLYNEHGISSQQSNADGFHNDLTLDYITNYASPFDLIKKIHKQQREINNIKNSASYKMGQFFAKILARLR